MSILRKSARRKLWHGKNITPERRVQNREDRLACAAISESEIEFFSAVCIISIAAASLIYLGDLERNMAGKANMPEGLKNIGHMVNKM